jgi:hypothetical protein
MCPGDALKARDKKKPRSEWVRALGLRAWQFPTFAWQSATLSLALSGFTSEFGMGSGGSRSLWSPSKLVWSSIEILLSVYHRPSTINAVWRLLLEICNLSLLNLMTVLCLFIYVVLLAIAVGFCNSQSVCCQTYWVLYGQASRAISTR